MKTNSVINAQVINSYSFKH